MFRYVHFSFLPFFDRTLTCFSFFSMHYFCIELEGYMLIQILMCVRPCDLFRTSINFFFSVDIVTLGEERATQQKIGWLRHRLNNILLLALSQMNMHDGQSTHHYQHRSHLRWNESKTNVHRASVVMFESEAIGPIFMIRNNIPEDWPTIIIGFMYLSFFIHLNCIQTNFTPPVNSS
jgi:hypothetical protein